MIPVLFAHALAALFAPSCVKMLGRNGFLVLAVVPLGSLGWVVSRWGSTPTTEIPWVPGLSMNIELRMDHLAAVLAVLVLGVGALILVYCSRYFTDVEPRLPAFAGYLVAFAGSMFGLVVSDNMLLLTMFWEITTVLSFLLVGHNAERATARRAATQALLVTTAGGLTMLAGVIALGESAGSYRLSDVVAYPPQGWLVDVAIGLILVGALSKSAVVPWHFWLPGAMAAPTPVSAYLHAAAMVKAGIYLVARLAPGYADTLLWHPMIITLGLISMVLAGWRALQLTDLKLVLAFGTVSQLGLLVVLVGIGTPDAALAGLTLLVAHAFFKATLFMVVGIVDHGTGTRDLRKLAGLGRKDPVLFGVAVLAAASMAGLPPLLGFVGKEAALEAAATSGLAAGALVLGVIVTGSMLTVAYSLRFLWGAFGDKETREPSAAVRRYHRPDVLLLGPPAVLAAAGLAAGLAAPFVDEVLGTGGDYRLALWHGLGPTLALTAVAIAGGVALFAARYVVLQRLRTTRPLLGNADRGYDWVLRTMDRISMKLTGSTQRGSLPVTQATILATLVLLPTILLAVGARSQLRWRLWDSPVQLLVCAVMAVAAVTATLLRNRLACVLLVGVTGYGCGVIFAMHGAPDLALTQFLVETLTLVIFVLVLRKFGAEFEPESDVFRPVRAAIAVVVGITVTILAAFAISARSAPSIAVELPEAAYHLGHGRNVVNVLLVDIRAWDTLGEISVLLVAATGVASLVFRHRRFGSAPRVPAEPDNDAITWLRGGEFIPEPQRYLMLEITTRLVFPTIMVLSVYFFFAGHNHPGGGFAGGLTAGLALVLRYLAGGRYELGEALPIDAGHILGAGLICSAGTAAASLLLGAPVLSSATLEVTVPLLGHITLVTAMFFDLGVYLIVVGLVLDVLRSLGARLDSAEEAR